MGRLLRENFGRGPGGVFTVISPPFVTVYFKSFLLPLEKALLDKEYNSSDFKPNLITALIS